MREITTTGLICLDDSLGLSYRIAKITYAEREDESFTYSFEPCYGVIDLLDSSLYQGIPGLDMSMRKPRYVRNNVTPVFIEERTPAPGREDLVELLDAEGMEYLNRLEWLIRTNLRYGGDNLYVRRWRPDDDVTEVDVGDLRALGRRSGERARKLLELLCMGHDVRADGFTINDVNRADMYHLLISLYGNDKHFADTRRQEGVDRAKRERKYGGRKPISIDPRKLDSIGYAFLGGEISASEAASQLGISVSTLRRRMKKLFPEAGASSSREQVE